MNLQIDPLSPVPLHVECRCAGATAVSSGTAFAVVKDGRDYLVTNGHVVTGRHPITRDQLCDKGFADPDTITVWFHAKGALGTWHSRELPLRDDSGQPNWLEHPLGLLIDVVAFPITLDPEVMVYPLDLTLADTDMSIVPSESVSIVGFPFGLSVNAKWPIWKTGHIASDIDLDFTTTNPDGSNLTLPCFLIDATTTSGMSGSPVVARRVGIYRDGAGNLISGGEANRFLGVYSGRVRQDADLGMVWKPRVLAKIIS